MLWIVHLAVQTFTVNGMSMESTLHNGQVVLVDKWTYLFHQPARGDIVVFHAPPALDQDYIKRIIAVPGDVVSVTNGMPIVDGMMLKEFYVSPLHLGRSSADRPVNNLVVPPGSFFVMGDDRALSFDSRAWGLLPRKDIIGRAVMVLWPIGDGNSGLFPDASSVFDQLPGS
jgi:signal peptidase I